MRVAIASTDLREYWIKLLAAGLREVGIEPIIAGVCLDPDEIADLAPEADATAVLVSTHNGMALTYARKLITELSGRGLNPIVMFGGSLNEDTEEMDARVDVTDDLRRLAIEMCDA
jgi:methylmalonyl-CoA mutase cobalamin-binding domain/chain